MALKDFKAEKCWRFWSTADAGVHYAVYQFADMAKLDAAMKDREPSRRLSPTSTGVAERRDAHAAT